AGLVACRPGPRLGRGASDELAGALPGSLHIRGGRVLRVNAQDYRFGAVDGPQCRGGNIEPAVDPAESCDRGVPLVSGGSALSVLLYHLSQASALLGEQV